MNDPKPFRYKFRWGEADGFMLQSMDRAFLQGNENYIPIKELNKKGKKVIVGFIDNSQSGKGKNIIIMAIQLQVKNSLKELC